MGLVFSVKNHFDCVVETLLPAQTVAGIAWVFCGMLSHQKCAYLWDGSIFLVLFLVMIARFFGMCFNRVCDWKLDGYNPRTACRCLPQKRCSVGVIGLYGLIFLGVFLYGASLFQPQKAVFGYILALAILVYSLLKRVTCWCHFFLGAIYSALPLAGVFWSDSSVDVSAILLALMAFAIVSGSDIIYSIQDVDSDKKLFLKSIPVQFGTRNALEIAACLHVLAVSCMMLFLYVQNVNPCMMGLGLLMVFGIMVLWRLFWCQSVKNYLKMFRTMLFVFPLSLLSILLGEFLCELL